ncbi:MAG: single-stranded DNA-binding protein, partial [Dehalococcoidia bacterium]|nr:single-stranded DNA-binding protein [Dehalococcoidia bacterium]
WTEDTEWFTITAWERQAESVNQYLSKGRRVFVDGRLSTRQYTSSSGEARTSLEVRAFKVVFLDSPSGDATNTTEGVPTEAQSYTSQGSGSVEPDENNLTEDVEELPW